MTGFPLILWTHHPGRLLVVAAVVLAALYVVSKLRRHSRHRAERVCPQCGESNPPHASFCRACGRELL